MERNTIELMTYTAIKIDETGVHNKVSASEEMNNIFLHDHTIRYLHSLIDHYI